MNPLEDKPIDFGSVTPLGDKTEHEGNLDSISWEPTKWIERAVSSIKDAEKEEKQVDSQALYQIINRDADLEGGDFDFLQDRSVEIQEILKSHPSIKVSSIKSLYKEFFEVFFKKNRYVLPYQVVNNLENLKYTGFGQDPSLILEALFQSALNIEPLAYERLPIFDLLVQPGFLSRLSDDQKLMVAEMTLNKYPDEADKVLLTVAKTLPLDKKITLTKLCAEKHGTKVAETIHEMRITDEDALTEIALICIKNKNNITSLSIAEYDDSIAKRIHKFGITNEQKLLEITKELMKDNFEDFSESFDFSLIQGHSNLVRLINEALDIDPNFIAQLKNFELSDEERMEIIERVFQKEPEIVLNQIEYLGIQDPLQSLSLFLKGLPFVEEELEFTISSDFYTLTDEGLAKQLISLLDPLQELGITKMNEEAENHPSIQVQYTLLCEQTEKLTQWIEETWPETIGQKDLKTLEEALVNIGKDLNNEKIDQQLQATRGICIALLRFHLYEVDSITIQKMDFASFLVRLASLHNSKLRSSVSEFVASKFVKTPSNLSHLSSLKKETRPYMLLPNFFLSELASRGNSTEIHEIAKQLSGIKKSDKSPLFKDSKCLDELLSCLNELSESQTLTSNDRTYLLKLIVSLKGNSQDVRRTLRTIAGIIKLGSAEKLSQSRLTQSIRERGTLTVLDEIYQDAFNQLIPIGEVVDFSDKYKMRFQNSRAPEAILTYGAALSKLPSSTRTEVLEVLGEFVKNVLDETYQEWRYDLESSEHLATLFNDDRELYSNWQESLQFQITDLVTKKDQQSSGSIDFGTIFLQEFNDGHLSVKEYPLLYRYLTNPNERTQLKTEMNDILKKTGLQTTILLKKSEKQFIQEGMSKEEIKVKLREVREDLQKRALPLRLQKNLIELSTPSKKRNDLALLKQTTLLFSSHTDQEFISHFNSHIHQLEAREKDKPLDTSLTVLDTDDYMDLLMCGTDVEGSCQHINRDTQYNKCLVGYLADGKNRMIAIKDQDGKIVARSMIRILIDPETNKPGLMLERVYPALTEDAYQKAIMRVAEEKAKQLQCPLYAKKVGTDIEEETVRLQSLSCRAPYEYVDSGSGVETGSYIIRDCQVLFRPE